VPAGPLGPGSVGFFDGAEVGVTGAKVGVTGAEVGCLVGVAGAGGAGAGVGVIEHSVHPLQPSQVHANFQVFFIFTALCLQ